MQISARPFTVSAPASSGPSSSISSDDDQTLKELGQQDMLHLVGEAGNSDKYGKSLSSFEAHQLLASGKPLVLTHPNIASLSDSRYPDGHKWWIGNKLDQNTVNYVETEAANQAEREGTFIHDSNELNRYVEANGMLEDKTKTPHLSPEESTAASSLRKFQGGLNGTLTPIFTEDDFHVGYYFKSKSDHGDGNEGLYNPNVKRGGFLGLGGHQDRLTPYEAMNLLGSSQSVRVVHQGRTDLLHSFDELKAYDGLGG